MSDLAGRPGEDPHRSARHAMVRDTIEEPGDRRAPVTDPRVLAAMRTVPRHRFVAPELEAHAYEDRPLSIGHGQTISQPYIVAIMTELLGPGPDEVVLEVGTGCGYQAAVLAHLVRQVYTIEIVEPLGREAAERLNALGYANVEVRIGDGYRGWAEHAPFDGILVTCAPDHVPQPLVDQLRPGGRLVIPVGPEGGDQQLWVYEKQASGGLLRQRVMPVRFVPLTGEHTKAGRNGE